MRGVEGSMEWNFLTFVKGRNSKFLFGYESTFLDYCLYVRYDGTYYVADRDPQSPDVAKLFEVDFGSGFVDTQAVSELQGPWTDYTTTGVIGDLRDAWLAEFGYALNMDSTYHARLNAHGTSYLGLHFINQEIT